MGIKKNKNLIVLVLLIVLSFFAYKGYQYWLASMEVAPKEIILNKKAIPEKEIASEEKITEEEEEEEEKSSSLSQISPVEDYEDRIFLSSNRLEQGDSLLIKVEGKTENIKGKFGQEKLDFVKVDDDWISIFGINVKKNPGEYSLSINIDEEKLEKGITVVKRNFPITELYVSEELEKEGYTQQKIAENIAKKDNPSIYQVLEIYTPTSYFDKPFTYPLNKIKIVGAYGNIRKKGEIQLQHLGVDLDAEVGTPVYAINNGVVCFTEDLINYGKTLIVDHGLGIYSLYLHLSSFNAEKDQKVKVDDIIGFSGNTGYSIAPHLHFSVKVNGASVDPLRFIKTTSENW